MSKNIKNKQTNKPKHGKELGEDILASLEADRLEVPQNQARRRLKKLREVNPDEAILSESDNQNDFTIRLDDEQPEYRQFDMKDDADLQKEKIEQKNAKKNKQLKGNQELDKFLTKKTNEKPVEEKPKPKVQLTLFEMMKLKKQKKPKRKSSDEFIVNDNESIDEEDAQALRLLAYEKYNGTNESQEQLVKKAMKLSLTAASKQKDNSEDYPIDNRELNKKITVSLKKERNPSKSVQKQEEKPKKRTKKQVTPPVQGPLLGYAIVFTGEYQICEKDELIRICGELGAQCPKSVTKKCNLLLQGSFVLNHFKQRMTTPISETAKSREALQKGIKIIQHDKIDDFFLQKTGQSIHYYLNRNCSFLQQEKSENQKVVSVEQLKKDYEKKKDFFDAYRFEGKNQKDQNKNPQKQSQRMDIQKPIKQQYKPEIKPQRKQQIKLQNNRTKQVTPYQKDFRLWTEKYKPKSLSQIVGSSSQIRNIWEWLEAWEDIHVRGNKRQIKQYKGWNAGGNINSKAALLSGDPGIGKTTTARLIAKEKGYEFTEYNASDVRNKTGIGLIQYDTINVNAAKKHETKTLIIMDEVDGMSSGDRGGVAAIINMIKNTKVPIICICNDRSSEKIRSLATHCLDVKFQKPNKTMVVSRIKDVLKEEGGSGEEKVLEQLVETFQSDMRQILNYIEIVFKTVSPHLTMNLLLNKDKHSKDASVMINDSDAARKLMNRAQFKSMKISERTQCFFIDSDRVPLSVHENILSSAKKGKLNLNEMHSLVTGLYGFVLGDMLDRSIRKEQEWGLMPSYGFMSCVYSTQKISQALGFPAFPAWLGKFSSERKNRRLGRQFKNIVFPTTLCSSWKSVKFLYSPMIIEELVALLKREEIQMAISFMENYNINPAILAEHLTNMPYKMGKDSNPFEGIPTKVKASLTRTFNKRHEDSKLKAIKGGKVKAEHVKFDPILQEMADDNIQEEEEQADQNDENSAEVGQKPKQVKVKVAKKKKQ